MQGRMGYLLGFLGGIYRRIVNAIPNPDRLNQQLLFQQFATRGVARALNFSDAEFRGDVLAFTETLRVDGFRYRYAPSSPEPTLYSSIYACLILSLFDVLKQLSVREREQWAGYFDSFQSAADGLFRDPAVAGTAFENHDFWGARHLVLHILPAYVALGHVPRHRFGFLDPYRGADRMLASDVCRSDLSMLGDIDNKIMNIVCALQYERDTYGDVESGSAVSAFQQHLWARRDPVTGLWGDVDINDPASLSRGVQFAYHLYSIFAYDGWEITPAEALIDSALATQNAIGGYGVAQNSSACEDIDSIELLCRTSLTTSHRNDEVMLSLQRARIWILANQNEDGGLVFRRNEPFLYGHPTMSSRMNESALFPTWFRSLSLAFISARTNPSGGYDFVRCPGLQFGLSSSPSRS